jgi:hypothetical protein
VKWSRYFLAMLLTVAPIGVRASTTCQGTPQGQLCVSEVNFSRFAQSAFQSQLQSQWCWAASIAMVFSYYGHPVSQSRIVSDVYGSAVNMPAMAGIVMARELNKTWIDDTGQTFQAQVTGIFDAQAGVLGLTNQDIVQELDQGRPLIIGARTHAMVLTAVRYYVTPAGPNVVGAGVFDPWPGVGARALNPDEITPYPLGGTLLFLATARLTGGEAPSSPSDTVGCSTAPGPEATLATLGWTGVLILRRIRRRVG